MNWRNVVILSAAAVFGLVLLPGSAVSQQKSLKDQLVGTWTLVSWEQVRPDGSKLQRFGTNPKGITVYDANGRVFVMFARPDLPKIASNSPSTPTPEEAKALVAGSIAYYGTYTVDDETKIVTVRIDSTTFPNQIGREQKRAIASLTADEIRYTNTTATSGGQIHIVMKRVK